MPLVPTKRLAGFAYVAAAVAVVAGFVPAVRAPLLLLDAALALLVVADVLAVLGHRIGVTRTVAQILSLGRANPVTLLVENRSDRALSLTLDDDPVEDADAPMLPASVQIAPRQRLTVRYELTPTRRGPRTLGGVTARYPGPLGLVQRQERTALPADVDVYPDVHAARLLELLRRQGRQDARLGSMRVRGGDTDFERLRPYAVGDEPRFVDWRATARRDDLTVRQFQAESDQNVVFALDVGRSMRGESEGLTAVDHALNAALLAADVALRTGDKAGLLVFDDRPRTFVPPTGGRAGARKITRAIYALDASLAASDYRAATAFLQTQVKARSLFILFTHVLDSRSARELASALRSLLPRHLPLCVLMRDVDLEAMVATPAASEEDLYAKGAAAEQLAAREDLLRALRKAGVLVLDAKPGDVTPDLVKRYLEVKARRLL